MSLDFDRLSVSNSADTVLHPNEIFSALPTKKSPYSYLRAVQAEVLDQWFNRRLEKDIVIKMNTGSGKTFVGLLLLKSCLNEGKYPLFYITPDNYLAKQVLKVAEDLGINVNLDPKSNTVLRGQAICVTTIHRLVNGMSIFGVKPNPPQINIANIVIDDAHACLSTTEGQFTLVIDSKKQKQVYNKLILLFHEDLRQQSEIGVVEVESGDPLRDMIVPYWAWIDKQGEVVKILHNVRDEEDIKFIWPLIKEHLYLCRCVFGGNKIEISPRCLPIDSIPSFVEAKNRIYMSATLSDDNILVSNFDIDPEAVIKPITPKNANDIGDRMILVPQELSTDISDDDIKAFLSKLKTKYNIVVIVPSNYRADYWADISSRKLTSENLNEGVRELQSKQVGLVVLVNKYDGIDLPGNACRILVIDGIPDVRRKIDKIEQTVLMDSEIVLNQEIQRIEQGMGRGIRNNDDYCVVFLMGASLVKSLYAMNAQRYFGSATKAQIDLSLKIAEQVRGKNLDELEEVINYSLNRDSRWLKASRGVLVNMKYAEQGNIDAIVLKQRAAFNGAQVKRFDDSVKLIQEAVDAASDPSIKGWLKSELAEYMHHLDPVRSQEILKSALSDNPRVLKPLAGITYTKLSIKEFDQAKLCLAYLNRYSGDMNKFIIFINGIINEIQFKQDSYRRFEQAMKDLAFIVGFMGQRPELELGRGPDVLWEVGELNYFVIECKNEAETDKISKKDCDQLSGAINWFSEKYDKTCSSIPIMVHPSNIVDYQASPNPNMRIINFEKQELLKKALLTFAKAIAASQDNINYQFIAKLLDQCNLSANKFINVFTVEYRIEKK